MEGSIAIRARGLTRAAAPPPREACGSQSQEARLGNKAEARVLTALAVPALTSKQARTGAKTEMSLRGRETAQFEGAMNRCFSLFREMGPKSPNIKEGAAAAGMLADNGRDRREGKPIAHRVFHRHVSDCFRISGRSRLALWSKCSKQH